MNHEPEKREKAEVSQESVPFEDALNLVGSGRYSVALLLSSCVIQLASAIDMSGTNLILPTSKCDLNMNVKQQGILSSLPFIGVILVSYFWGYIADTRGRRKTLLWSMYASFVFSCLGSLSPNWIVLAVIKFLSVCFSCAANAATFTLLGECCPARIRSRYILLVSCAFVSSQGFNALLAYPILSLNFSYAMPWLGISFRPWRLLIIAMATPMGLGALSMHFFHESPKFLVHQGKQEEAIEALRRMYSVNNRIPPELFPVKSVYLEEEATKSKSTEPQSLLKSMWHQTVPLFRRPLLVTTLRLFYIIVVTYVTNNSFGMWMPQIFNAFFEYIAKGDQSANRPTLCTMLQKPRAVVATGNVTMAVPVCDDTLANNTLYIVLFQAILFCILNLIVAKLSSFKKSVLIFCISATCISCACVSLMPEPISSVVFVVILRFTTLCHGIVPVYFVDLYPTAYRGMVASLGIMVGRLCSFAGVNIMGNWIFSHCRTTFYFWAALVFSGIVVAWWLPPDRIIKKGEENNRDDQIKKDYQIKQEEETKKENQIKAEDHGSTKL